MSLQNVDIIRKFLKSPIYMYKCVCVRVCVRVSACVTSQEQ